MCVGMLKKVLGTPSPMKSVIDSVPSPIGETGAQAIGAGVTATTAAKKRASLLATGGATSSSPDTALGSATKSVLGG